MSASHHGDNRSERELHDLRKRFLEQVAGRAKREWSAGRMGAEDDGDLAYAITTDVKRGVIIIRYGKPVEWIVACRFSSPPRQTAGGGGRE